MFISCDSEWYRSFSTGETQLLTLGCHLPFQVLQSLRPTGTLWHGRTVFCILYLQQNWRGDGSNKRSPSGVNDHKSWRPRLHNDTQWSEFLLMDVLGHLKETWVPKNWCFWTMVLEKTLENPLDSKGIKPVNPKGHQPWIFIGRTDAEAETLILWPPDGKSWLIGKDPDAGKDWGKEEKEMTEDKVVGWHHRLNRHKITKSRRQWRTGKPGMLPFMGWQRVRHDLAPEQQHSSPWRDLECLSNLTNTQ